MVAEAPAIGRHRLAENQNWRPGLGGIARHSNGGSGGEFPEKELLGIAIGLEIARIPHLRSPMGHIALFVRHLEIQLRMRILEYKFFDHALQHYNFMHVVRYTGSVVCEERNRGR